MRCRVVETFMDTAKLAFSDRVDRALPTSGNCRHAHQQR